MSQAVQLLLSAVIGAAAGAFATAYKSRKELESLYDIELRRRRIDAYAELWKLLEPLAYWSPPGPVTFAGVEKLSRALRGWYFRTGGLVLSRETRAPYFNLQEALTHLGGESDAALDDDTHEIVKALASRLRTASTQDVATRVEPRLAGAFGSGLGRLRREPLRVEIDRRWDFGQTPAAAYFVVVENTSRQDVDVRRVRVGDVEVTDEAGRDFVLQPAEARELRAPVRGAHPRAGEVPVVTVDLARGGVVQARQRPAVPLRAPVLDLPRQKATRG